MREQYSNFCLCTVKSYDFMGWKKKKKKTENAETETRNPNGYYKLKQTLKFPIPKSLSSLSTSRRRALNPLPTNLTPLSFPHQSVSSLSLSVSHRSSLSFSLIDPLSIYRNRFSVRTIFSKEESSFVDFTDARKKGFPTAPIKTHFRYASVFPQSLFIPIETHVEFCPYARLCVRVKLWRWRWLWV